MTDEMTVERCRAVEGAALVADSCAWLAEQHRQDGKLTADAWMWEALGGLAISIALIASRSTHPTIVGTIKHGCDGIDASNLMLKTVGAMWAGDQDGAEEFSRLAASFEGKL